MTNDRRVSGKELSISRFRRAQDNLSPYIESGKFSDAGGKKGGQQKRVLRRFRLACDLVSMHCNGWLVSVFQNRIF